MKQLFNAALLALLICSWAIAQDVPGEYIVELAGNPAVATAPAKGPRLSSGRAAVQAAQASVRSALAAANVEVTASVDTVMNALIVKSDDPALLSSTPGVARVYPVRLYKMVLDHAVILQNLPAAAERIGGAENAGAGIKIGIVDSGIDVSHPAFNDSGFTLPDGFPRVNKDTDNSFTNKKVIVARNYDTRISATATDRKGHGTAVAMIAAGVRNAGPRATIMGIAPKAYLGSYKVFPDGQDGAPNSAILKAIDDAVADGMDVINLSLGAFPAERLDSDPLVTAVENASRAGVIVVIAVGNDGPGLNTIGSPGTAPSALSVGSSSNDRVFASSAWLEGLNPFLAVPADAPRSANIIRGQLTDVSAFDPTGLACNALPEGSLSGKIVLILRGVCFFEDKLNNASRAGAIGAVIYTDAERPTTTMSIGAAILPAVMITYADGLKARERLQSSSAEVVIDFSQSAVPSDATRLPDFTSKGPGVDNHLKPELLAVGTSVYTAFPSASYTTMQGTSFSAPMVAGAAALLKAYRPGLSVGQYKSLLMNSTSQFVAGLQETGAGLLDIGASVRSTVTAIPSALEFGVGGSTLNATRSFVLRNMGSTSETYSISAAALNNGVVPVVSPDVVQLEAGASADISVRLNEPNLSAQSHEGFLTIRGAQTETTTRVPYWYAATDGKGKSINIVEAPEEGRRASAQNFYVRVLDTAGVPLPSEPKVTVVTGVGASVMSVESVDFRYPGFYQIRVRLSSEPGENVFEIDGGGVTTRLTISGS